MVPKVSKNWPILATQPRPIFLSRDACIVLGIVPKGFPNEQINMVRSVEDGKVAGQNPINSIQGGNPSLGGRNPISYLT